MKPIDQPEDIATTSELQESYTDAASKEVVEILKGEWTGFKDSNGVEICVGSVIDRGNGDKMLVGKDSRGAFVCSDIGDVNTEIGTVLLVFMLGYKDVVVVD